MSAPATADGRRKAIEVAWVLAGHAATVAGSLAVLRLLTSLMTPDEYGRLALGLTLAGLVGQVVTGGLANGIGRFRSIAVEAGDLPGYLTAARRLALRAAFWIVVGGAALTVAMFLSGRPSWGWIAVWVIPFAILTGWSSMLAALQAAARNRARVAFFSAAEQWLRLPMAWGLSIGFGAGAPTVVAAFAAASLVVVWWQRDAARGPTGPPGSAGADWAHRILAFARPFSIFGLFAWMQQSSDRWSLETWTDTSAVGTFAVLFQLGYAPVSTVSGLAMAVLGPVLYQRAGDAACADRMRHVRATIDRLCLAVLALSALGTLLAALFHGAIFAALVGPEFRNASPLLPWLVAAGGLFGAGQVLSVGMMAEVRTSRLVLPKVATALVGIGLNVGGAMVDGVRGVAIASTLFSLLYLAWIAVVSRKPTPVAPAG